jgi:hypothetical protein
MLFSMSMNNQEEKGGQIISADFFAALNSHVCT